MCNMAAVTKCWSLQKFSVLRRKKSPTKSFRFLVNWKWKKNSEPRIKRKKGILKGLGFLGGGATSIHDYVCFLSVCLFVCMW